MKRTIAITILLCATCGAAFAQLVLFMEAPQDDRKAREDVYDRPELKTLHDAYVELIQTRLRPLQLEDVAKIFGPKLQPTTNWAGTESRKYPADLVLPTFATDGHGGGLILVLSGVQVTPPAVDKRHTDLHAIGDIGYLESYYFLDGVQKEADIIYFRADKNFVPLTSTTDFPKRLEWEKARFKALQKWLDVYLPKLNSRG